jgi:DNA replication protein DnaC
LLGPSFAGKTTVARKWCEHRKKEGASVAGVVWPEFIASIKHRGSNQRSAYLNALGDQDVILLDDVLIGSDQATEQDILQGIIDRRREWPQLTTMMTTNITKEAIERMPERIQNRIKLYQPVVMRGHWG